MKTHPIDRADADGPGIGTDPPPADIQLAAPAIETRRLSKSFGSFSALSDCSLSVHQNCVFGLLGPNGAGKSTLIRLLLGFLKPSSGDCRIANIDTLTRSIEARQMVSYLPGDARLPRHMRGKRVLEFFAEMHSSGDLQRSRQVAAALQLDLTRHVGFMSTGMRQKLALAVVLGPRTPVLILDEPTANLDPTVRNIVLELVREAKSEGRTVVFSSHVMSEIEQTCDDVAFLKSGQVVGELALNSLARRHRVSGIAPRPPAPLPNGFEANDTVTADSQVPDNCYYVSFTTDHDLAGILPWLTTNEVTQLRIEPIGLNAVYEAVHAGERPSCLTKSVPAPVVETGP